MSISHQKQRLIKEAVYNYQEAKRKHGTYSWRFKLSDFMRADGWYVHHDGSEKFVAMKGPVITKWDGMCEWFTNCPVREEMRIYRKLNSLGLSCHTPTVYAFFGDLIIEQNVGDGVIPSENMRNKLKCSLKKHGVYISDLKHNCVMFNGVLKVYDGMIWKE